MSYIRCIWYLITNLTHLICELSDSPGNFASKFILNLLSKLSKPLSQISLLYNFEQHSKCCISIDSIPQICTLKWLSCMLRHCQKRCYFTTASDPCNIAGSLVLTSNCHQIWIGQPLQSHGRVICAKATIACPWLLNQWRAVCQNDEINNPNLHSTSWTNTSHLMSFGKTHAAAPGLHLCDPAEPWAAFCRWGSWLLDTPAATAE